MRALVRAATLATALVLTALGLFASAQGAVIFHDAFIVKPPTAPSAPLITLITASDTALEVAFVPGSDRGSPIINYEYSVDNGDIWTTRNPASTASPLDIMGLSNGTEYAVRIRAVNALGAGTSSNLVTGTPETVPSAPVINSVLVFKASS